MKRKILDSWKRPTEIEVVDTGKIPQQLDFNFGPRDATPKEFDDWYKDELEPWGEKQLSIVFVMALVQFSALAFMMLSFFVIGRGL